LARTLSRHAGIALIVAFAVLMLPSIAAAADVSPGWGKWWLPPNRSAHGGAIDSLFVWIFWITMITFVAVEVVMVIFLIKYRDRKGAKKAFFTHGNQKLEMAWTIAPAIILAILALGSKKVWDNFRYANDNDASSLARVLVIGQQFKWNFVYPGPDGKFGKYLVFPRPTDIAWPAGADGAPVMFKNIPGPASLPYAEAVSAINEYIDSENPLGKDFTDPDGKDDNFEKAPGRGLVLPAHRPIEVQLTSKDVLHDFFLPNFRVKLDAVPGMRGHLYFTSTMTSADRRKFNDRTISLDELSAFLDQPGNSDAALIINETSPGTAQNKNQDRTGWRYVRAGGQTITRNGLGFGDVETRNTRIAALKEAGLTDVLLRVVEESGDWELVCEGLCGQGHNTMTAKFTVLSNEEYNKLNYDKPYTPAPIAPPASAPTP
jgi:heme/copper-type cytochrome/quinol oxidase subunit 2